MENFPKILDHLSLLSLDTLLLSHGWILLCSATVQLQPPRYSSAQPQPNSSHLDTPLLSHDPTPASPDTPLLSHDPTPASPDTPLTNSNHPRYSTPAIPDTSLLNHSPTPAEASSASLAVRFSPAPPTAQLRQTLAVPPLPTPFPQRHLFPFQPLILRHSLFLGRNMRRTIFLSWHSPTPAEASSASLAVRFSPAPPTAQLRQTLAVPPLPTPFPQRHLFPFQPLILRHSLFLGRNMRRTIFLSWQALGLS